MGEREKSLEKISHVKAREEIAKEKAPRAGVPRFTVQKKGGQKWDPHGQLCVASAKPLATLLTIVSVT